MYQVSRNMKRSIGLKYLIRNWELYAFMLPALVYLALYCYYPMYGVQIAFKDYRITQGISGSEWVGIKHFINFLGNPTSRALISNTIVISVYSLIIGFPLPIMFSLMLNEIRHNNYRKIIQTVSYAPHFISIVVMVSMLNLFLDKNSGIINKMIVLLGGDAINFMTRAYMFPSIYVFSGIWQNLGWSSVIYMSALSGIDPELHEAAMIDGATRLKRIYHINFKGILPTVTILLILQTGNLMTVGFEKSFLMQNPFNLERSEIISTFVYKMGLQYRQYSFSTAIGLFNSIINMILLFSVNALANRINDSGLW